MQGSALFLLKQIRRRYEILEDLFWRASDRFLSGTFIFCLMVFSETSWNSFIIFSFQSRIYPNPCGNNGAEGGLFPDQAQTTGTQPEHFLPRSRMRYNF